MCLVFEQNGSYPPSYYSQLVEAMTGVRKPKRKAADDSPAGDLSKRAVTSPSPPPPPPLPPSPLPSTGGMSAIVTVTATFYTAATVTTTVTVPAPINVTTDEADV